MNKLSPSALSLCVVAALGFTACGQSENAEVNTTLVESELGPAVESLLSFRTGKVGADAIGPIMSLGSLGQAMLKPQEVESSNRASLVAAQARKLARMAREKGGEQCTCDEDKCNFDGCDLGEFGSMKGKIEWTENSLTCDYSSEFSLKEGAIEFSTSLSTQCDLKFTDTTLDGTLSHEGSMEGKGVDGEVSIRWESSFAFDGIKYDEDKQKITEGTAKVEAQVDVQGEDTLRGSASIDFSKE